MIGQPLQLAAVFLAVVLLSVWLDARYSWARKISPVVLILFFAGLVSNVGLITDRSTFYDGLAGFTVPFAVCLILFTVNLADLKKTGGPLLAAFAIACVGTIIGVLSAGLLVNSQLARVLDLGLIDRRHSCRWAVSLLLCAPRAVPPRAKALQR